MPEIKVVLYQGNSTPRSIALTTRTVYRTLFLSALLALALVISTAAAVKFYLLSHEKNAANAPPKASSQDDGLVGPKNTLEEQNKSLTDQVDQLRSRIANMNAARSSPREIDKKSPALALFSPVITDRAQSQNQVEMKAIKYSKKGARSPATLTFELHNANPASGTVEKGYIVVLARAENQLLAYPNVFTKSGPYLLDFEMGETFQVARFRMVNAEFDEDSRHFQILIFGRNGDLLINASYEVPGDAGR
jgi:hypothetical protein